jgi:hypothetical protein
MGAVVFNRKPSSPELPSLLSPVLWLLLRVQLFLCRLRPKHPDAPCTEAEALAWLQNMLQAVDAFVASSKNGTLPPQTPPAATAPNAPCAAPPPRQQTESAAAHPNPPPPPPNRPPPEPKPAPARTPPRLAPSPPLHAQNRSHHHARRPAAQAAPPRQKSASFFHHKKIGCFQRRPDCALFVAISQ